jgi:hypothetical protein
MTMRSALPTTEPVAADHNDTVMRSFAMMRGIVRMAVGVLIAAELN